MAWFWEEAFPSVPYEKPPGKKEMVIVVAYDITEPRRLARVARICEDHGARVQYSIIECHMDAAEFEDFWLKLLCEIDEDTDRLVAYKLDARAARETETAGTMVCSEKAVCYLV